MADIIEGEGKQVPQVNCGCSASDPTSHPWAQAQWWSDDRHDPLNLAPVAGHGYQAPGARTYLDGKRKA